MKREVPHFRIGLLLTEAGIISPTQLDEAIGAAEQNGVPFLRMLVTDGLLTQQELQAVVRAQSLIWKGLLDVEKAIQALKVVHVRRVSIDYGLKAVGWAREGGSNVSPAPVVRAPTISSVAKLKSGGSVESALSVEENGVGSATESEQTPDNGNGSGQDLEALRAKEHLIEPSQSVTQQSLAQTTDMSLPPETAVEAHSELAAAPPLDAKPPTMAVSPPLPARDTSSPYQSAQIPPLPGATDWRLSSPIPPLPASSAIPPIPTGPPSAALPQQNAQEPAKPVPPPLPEAPHPVAQSLSAGGNGLNSANPNEPSENMPAYSDQFELDHESKVEMAWFPPAQQIQAQPQAALEAVSAAVESTYQFTEYQSAPFVSAPLAANALQPNADETAADAAASNVVAPSSQPGWIPSPEPAANSAGGQNQFDPGGDINTSVRTTETAGRNSLWGIQSLSRATAAAQERVKCCQYCAAPLEASASVCQYCTGEVPSQPPVAMLHTDRFKAHIIEELKEKGTIIATTPPRDPYVVAFLSGCVLPGLGQLVLGQTAKSLVLIFLALALSFLAGGVCLLFVCPIAALDAYLLADKLRRGKNLHEWEVF